MNESLFARMFLAIMEHIETNVPEVRYIGADLGQLEGYSNRPAVDFPCVLIDFNGWLFDNLGDNCQTAEGDVVIKLGFAQYLDSSNLTEPEWRSQALAYWDIEKKLNDALHGWAPLEEAAHMTRTASAAENRPMGVRAVVVRYRLGFDDYTTASPDFIGQRPAVTISS